MDKESGMKLCEFVADNYNVKCAFQELKDNLVCVKFYNPYDANLYFYFMLNAPQITEIELINMLRLNIKSIVKHCENYIKKIKLYNSVPDRSGYGTIKLETPVSELITKLNEVIEEVNKMKEILAYTE